MARGRTTNPAMQVNNISPHSIAGRGGARGGTKGRDTPLSSGGSASRPRNDTTKAANWWMGEGSLRGTFGTDLDGFSPPNPQDAFKEAGPSGESGRSRRR